MQRQRGSASGGSATHASPIMHVGSRPHRHDVTSAMSPQRSAFTHSVVCSA